MVGGTLYVRGVGREFHASGFPTRGRFPGATAWGAKNTRSSPPKTDRRPASHGSIYSSQLNAPFSPPPLLAPSPPAPRADKYILVDIIEQVCRQSATCSRKGEHVIRYRAPRPAHSAARQAPCAHANGPLLPRRKRPRRSADRNELAAPGVRG